ncbi:calcineurin-like phosphoesterase family protein [Kocuria palustris]|uniref:calcineurin-like phosphoesterase C-terminal domain-containing protein n=1 Tax=Kocuria palustris TaxID=71999 RepID=UPI0006AA0E52|nr:calcineurin-like phosphoesterase family protein [Kocuria palustris]ALB03124.1 phosphoesterase [Kocuria palustris]MCT1833344.1 calcineurin-like phosphoesterase family protein [Kocuria palustris]
MSQHLSHPSTARSRDPRPRRALSAAVLTAGLSLTLLAPAPALAQEPSRSSTSADHWNGKAFRGQVDVTAGPDADQDVLDGAVFDDRNRNSQQDPGERGIAGVEVSNGRKIVTTDRQGRYEISVRDGETVFLTQPAGYQVPVDEDNVAQFFYTHMPAGSPELRYGGIDPTGPLPDAVDFPLTRTTDTLSRDQRCLIGGDIQTYTQEEVDYALRGAFADLAQRTDFTGCGALFIGDIVGDDLDLYDQTRELTSLLNGPARFLPGNHDLDLDADYDHRFDTYRSQFGPDYYSYDAGDVHVISLNTVQHSQGAPYNGTYNGGIDDEQLAWLRQDIANTPEDKLIVLATHIPLLNWHDQGSDRHQVDQVQAIHDIIGDRPAVAFGGHSHTLEVMREGDSMEGWKSLYGVDELPFDHITAGAISGDWYTGRVTEDGYPTALQRDGAVPGVFTLEAHGNRYEDSFIGTGRAASEQMSLGLNTPAYRDWYDANRRNVGKAPSFETPLEVSADELGESWLTTNVWAGGTGTEVSVSIDSRPAQQAQRTQRLEGESKRVGAEFSDPAAAQEQLVHGGSVAEASGHLWRLDLPEDLAPGEHTATVTQTDRYGVSTTERITFTVTS